MPLKETRAMTINARRVTPDNFAAFGKVVQPSTHDALVSTDFFRYWSDIACYHVEGETEIGYCTAYKNPNALVMWMERHLRTPEVLIPADAPFVLPVMLRDGEVAAFRVEPGEAVVLRSGAWHSACIPACSGSASYFVIFRRGTPHDDVDKCEIPIVRINL